MNSKLVLFSFVASVLIVTVTHVSGIIELQVYASSNSDFEVPPVEQAEARTLPSLQSIMYTFYSLQI
jgi:hypothetical protein